MLQNEDEIRKALGTYNSSFKFMPVSDTTESRNLRISHIQQTISLAFLKSIWQPFASRATFQDPAFCQRLALIADRLAAVPVIGGMSERASRVWSVLTTHALSHMEPDSRAETVAQSSSHAPNLSWANQVCGDILLEILPFADPLKANSLQGEILRITTSAIVLGAGIQSDQLQITMNPVLNPQKREEWRSQSLDPQNAETQIDGKVESRPRVFTLFPRITAVPSASSGTNSHEEICIHPGVGVPECASWVEAGRAEEEDRVRFLNEGMDELKKSANEKAKRRSSQSRRNSSASIAGPSSPTTLWKNEGKNMITEE